MNNDGTKPAAPLVLRTVADDRRNREHTAPLRCACYAAWSELTASPHDVDTREALRERAGAGTRLGYGAELDTLIATYLDTEADVLKRAYSGLFEVGSDGPPMPIREDLQTGQRAGTREDLVRFYDYFGYALGEGFAWQPDHLSVELEFMHYLCYREATAESDWMSFQLAQADFAERHLSHWITKLAGEVASQAGESLYARILTGLQVFLEQDTAWQAGTISGNPASP